MVTRRLESKVFPLNSPGRTACAAGDAYLDAVAARLKPPAAGDAGRLTQLAINEVNEEVLRHEVFRQRI